MNILFFSTYYLPYLSGITICPSTLFSNLGSSYHITVLTFPHSNLLQNEEYMGNQRVVRMPYQSKISKGFLSFSSLIYFFSYVKKSDVVILNIPNGEGLALAILARLMRKPIISIFHCEVDLGKTIGQRLVTWVLKHIVLMQLYLSTYITAYTKSYIQYLHFPHRIQKKIVYIYPPVGILPVDSQYKAELLKEKENKVWIGFAGRTAKEKGLEYLIEAIHILQKKNSIATYTLMFAGPYGNEVVGELEYYKYILSLLSKYHLSYHFLGSLSEEKLGAFYKAIDLLVLPSINKTEAFGMVQVDAMLLGTPIVAFDLPGVNEPIQKTHMGILATTENATSLANAIDTVLGDRNAYTNPQLQKDAQTIFSLQKTITFYRDLLQMTVRK